MGVAQATGRVLEVAVGTGRNLARYLSLGTLAWITRRAKVRAPQCGTLS